MVEATLDAALGGLDHPGQGTDGRPVRAGRERGVG